MNGNKVLVLALLLVPVLGACAAKKLPPRQPQAPHDNQQIVHDIGMVVQRSGGSLVVRSIVPGSPAEEAGVQARDAVLSIDGKKRTPREYFDLIMAKRAGDHLLLTIQRKNDVLRFDIACRETAVLPTVLAVRRMLSDERRVVLAIIPGRMTNNLPEPSEFWEDVMRTRIQGGFEGMHSGLFGEDMRFSLVDRLALGPTVLEYHITKTGTIPDHARIRIRELTRATHILLVNYSWDPAGQDCIDRTDASMIEAENGAVVASDHTERFPCR